MTDLIDDDGVADELMILKEQMSLKKQSSACYCILTASSKSSSHPIKKDSEVSEPRAHRSPSHLCVKLPKLQLCLFSGVIDKLFGFFSVLSPQQ